PSSPYARWSSAPRARRATAAARASVWAASSTIAAPYSAGLSDAASTAATSLIPTANDSNICLDTSTWLYGNTAISIEMHPVESVSSMLRICGDWRGIHIASLGVGKANGVIILAVVAAWTAVSLPVGMAIGHQLKRRFGDLAVLEAIPQG